MSWQPSLYAYTMFVAALIVLAGAFAAWQRRSKPGAVPMAFLMGALFVWSIGNSLELAVVEVNWKTFWSQIQYIGVTAAPTLWLILVLEFTGLGARWLTRRNLILLSILPAITLVAAWTNPLHELIWVNVGTIPFNNLWIWQADRGLLFWVFVVHSYGEILIGMVLLLRAAIQFPAPYRDQAFIMLLGGFIPWVANGVTILGIFDATPVDLTPYGFLLAGFLAFWALFQYKLADLAPVAREALVDSMDDAMIALDATGRVLDANPAAMHLLGDKITGTMGQKLTETLPGMKQFYGGNSPAILPTSEVEILTDSGSRWYDVKVSPLRDPHQRIQGRLVVLRDVSQRKLLEASLEGQIRRVNQLLEVARVTTKNPSLNETMQNTLTVAQSITKAEAGILVLLDEQKELTHNAFECMFEKKLETLPLRIKDGFTHHLLNNPRAFLIQNASAAPAWLRQDGSFCEFNSVLSVPIYYGENVLGGLLLMHSRPAYFTESDLEILTMATRQMALPLGNAIVFENQRIVAQQQTTLFNALQALQHPMLLQEALSETVEIFAQLTRWPLVSLLTPDAEGMLTISAAAGPLAGLLYSLLLNNPDSDSPPALPLGAISHETFPSQMLLPLKGQMQRLLLIASDTGKAFDEESRLLASSLGNVATLVLRNARLYESVSSEQQRLEALIQSSRDGIILISPENEIMVMSQMAIQYLGLEGDTGQWVHRKMAEALAMLRPYAPDVVKTTLAEIKRLRAGDASVGEGDYAIRGRDIHWLNLPVTEGEQPLGRLLILRDVTEDRRLEQLREDLTYTMVHDLRNPLTSIHSAMWLLNRHLKPTIPENYQTVLEIAHRSTYQLISLVNAILDISRLESGRLPMDLVPFDLGKVAADVLTVEKPLSDEKNIQLINQVDASLPLVYADRDLTSRIMQNLVGNAIKFTPVEGTITLAAQVRPDFPDKIVISVSDTGVGVPDKIREQLFQKFVTGMQEGRGTGLGLAFCKMVVEAHHEHIWLEDSSGSGTTFSFTLAQAQKEAA
ncbi:MAG: GAF domain-containing protein [Anaerolineae bacterium]|nr:GAF domain-containing protein [Anaerolineae bacterium]